MRKTIHAALGGVPVLLLLAHGAVAKTEAVWSEPIRGSWVASSTDEGVTLVGKDGPCEIVVDPAEHSAVHQAATFLAGDIETITGQRPAIVARPTTQTTAIHLATLGTADVPKEIARDKLEGRWEAFQILAAGKAVWLVGSNFRGTAFAAYTLSERIGIDPLHQWTGYRPERRNPLILKTTDFYSGPPTIKYRGTFHDDEDILARPFDDNGYPLKSGGVIATEWYARYFETALRLRMNMVAPYTRVRRRFEVQKMASDWGLFLTSHHYDVLLSNPYGMNRFGLAAERGIKPEWDWFKNREGMLGYWRAGVTENRDLSCVWPVGLRSGMEDLKYEFPPQTTDEEKRRVFREVIGEQVALAGEHKGADRETVCHFTIYGEMLELYKQDAFELPPEVILVWPDNCFGRMPALPDPANKGRNGIYYHLAFAPSCLQITHAVPTSLIAGEMRRVVGAGATEFLLVNVSEERECVKELRMLSDIAWNAEAALSGPEPADRFIQWWCREYFGEAAASDAAEACRWYERLIENHHQLRVASDVIHKQIPELGKKFAGEAFEPQTGETVEHLRARAEEFEAAFRILDRAQTKMGRVERQWFFDNVALGLLIGGRHNEAAIRLHEALLEPDKEKAWAFTETARQPLEQLETEILRAEHPPFEQWYRESWLRSRNSPFNVHRPYQELRAFIASDGRSALPELGRTDVF